jgi:signal transduction histidine kinase
MMPELNGFQVCDLLKEEPATRDIPVIFLTARTDSDSIIKGFQTGAVDYVSKPFNPEELLARVRTHLELRHAKKQVEESNRQLKEVNATKDKFFSIIAHDLRSPFQGLIGASQYLQESFDDLEKEQIREFIGLIHKTSDNAFALLENLLEWSRSQTGTLQHEPERINIRGIANNCIALLSQNTGEKQIRISNDVPLQIWAYADPKMTETVIRNLLNNAVKFTPKGGEIHITAEEQGDMIEIAVSDTGLGIPDAHIEKLFRIDSKLVSFGTRGEKGSGLGLILCRDFVEKNSGKIWVQSQVGEGSRFIFTLPKA